MLYKRCKRKETFKIFDSNRKLKRSENAFVAVQVKSERLVSGVNGSRRRVSQVAPGSRDRAVDTPSTRDFKFNLRITL